MPYGYTPDGRLIPPSELERAYKSHILDGPSEYIYEEFNERRKLYNSVQKESLNLTMNNPVTKLHDLLNKLD